MLNANVPIAENDSENIKPVTISRTLVRREPCARGSNYLPLLFPAHGLCRGAEIARKPGPNFHECDKPAGACIVSSTGDQIQVAMTVPKAPIENDPPLELEPLRRDLLATYSEFLPFGQHEPSLAPNSRNSRIHRSRESSNQLTNSASARVRDCVDFGPR